MELRRTELEDLNLNLAKQVGLMETQLKATIVVQRLLREILAGVLICMGLLLVIGVYALGR